MTTQLGKGSSTVSVSNVMWSYCITGTDASIDVTVERCDGFGQKIIADFPRRARQDIRPVTAVTVRDLVRNALDHGWSANSDIPYRLHANDL